MGDNSFVFCLLSRVGVPIDKDEDKLRFEIQALNMKNTLSRLVFIELNYTF